MQTCKEPKTENNYSKAGTKHCEFWYYLFFELQEEVAWESAQKTRS